MVIVSQDKKEVINFENILSVKLFHDDEDNECLYEIYTTVNAPGDNYILLGEYNTEERAKEVLQEIVSKYRQYNLDNNKAVTMIPKVYEMPKEWIYGRRG